MRENENLRELSQYFHGLKSSHEIDWDRVSSIYEGQETNLDQSEFWTKAACSWIALVAGEQENPTKVFETNHLVFMSSCSDRVTNRLASDLEKSLELMISYLGSASEDERFGKMGVLVFGDSLSYCDYVSRFYPEGSVVPMSGGLCIVEGYVHVALFEDEWGDLISAFVHEASHAYLCHLTLPTWMDEAIAMRMENLIGGRPDFPLNREIYERHRTHWNRENIEKFKSGESWSLAGESFDLSYQLAEILWKKIETTLEARSAEIQELIKTASWDDAGESALQKVFQIGLDDLVRSFLGDSIDR